MKAARPVARRFHTVILLAISVFIFVFPSLVRTSGLLMYTIGWVAPLVLYPSFSFGRLWFGGHFVVGGLATVVALLLIVAALLSKRRPLYARRLCLFAGLVSAPVGLVAVWIGYKKLASTGRAECGGEGKVSTARWK